MQSTSKYFGKDGEPLDLMEWGHLSSDWSYKMIAEDEFTRNDGCKQRVTTVWLGEDFDAEMQYCGKEMPADFKHRIFGTMVWSTGREDAREFRWATLEEAELRHAELVVALKCGDEATVKRLYDEHGQ
jgi:hypothetical protein